MTPGTARLSFRFILPKRTEESYDRDNEVWTVHSG